MKYKSGHKEETRRRILKSAAALFREKGVQGTSVPGVMEAAGLTVGGFYNHFESKADLLREAMAMSLEGTSNLMRLVDPALEGEAWLAAAAEIYLTEAHRANVRGGCALAALATDVARSEEGMKVAMEAGLDKLIDEIASHINPEDPASARPRAWSFWTQLLGSLILARAVDSDAMADEILSSSRAHIER